MDYIMSSGESQNTGSALELVNIDVTKSSVEFLHGLLDGYCKEGKYDLNDAHKIIVSLSNMRRAIETLDKLQNIAVKIQQNQKEQAERLKQQSLAAKGAGPEWVQPPGPPAQQDGPPLQYNSAAYSQ